MNLKEIFNLTVLTVITSVIWLGFSIYEAYFNQENTIVDPKLTSELKLEGFDKNILDNLPKKINYYK